MRGQSLLRWTSYSVTFEKPKYSVTALKSTANVTDSDLSNEFISQYTQLPDSLPQRIKDLASEITADEHTWYDKAVAIEQYFKGSQFSYDTENVMVPGGDMDYVDQFLFDSMRGYCDNFSTSMVVLLRSLDIPARWVKGYTEGEFRGYKEDDSTIRVFDVTNNNAHSWVEVYFPQVGWVSFEPTPGFSNDVSYNFDEGAEVSTPSVQMEEPETPKQNRVSQDSQSSIDNKQPFSFVKWWMGVKEFYSIKSEWILLVLLVLCGVGYYIYRIRVKWLPWYYIRKFKRLNEDESFENAYVVLLKQLERIGLKRKEDQTLREYAKFIDDYFSTIQMTELTASMNSMYMEIK